MMNFQPSRYRAFVTRVIDGDTLHIMLLGTELTVRLLLVDTPETHKPNTPVQPLGPEAEAFTRRLVEGRLYVDEKSLQEELLRRGLARVAYAFPPNVRYLDRYKEIQAEAMADGIGLWSPKTVKSNAGD